LRPRRLAAILAAASAFLCPALIFPCSEFALGPSLFEVICLLCGFQTGRLDGRRYQASGDRSGSAGPADVRRIRCCRCGGSTYIEAAEPPARSAPAWDGQCRALA